MQPARYDALRQLRDHIPRLSDLLRLENHEEIRFWSEIIDAKLLSRLSPDFPMVAAICGGGSSGKSTLFNSLIGEHFAPTGGKAGLNRRVLFSVPAARAERTGLLDDLAQPFNSVPEPLQNPEQLTVPGEPLYVLNQSSLDSLVVLDTPDFDTGAKGTYTNREITRMALEASDILIYIFTNSNYNNRDNTDFIAQMLTGIGMRKCILVYRAYPSFTPQEVLDHAGTVAKGIYGDQADQFVLGVYRTDEDNQVAAGQQFMKLSSVKPQDPEFFKALQSIDGAKLRFELYGSILADVLKRAEKITRQSRFSFDELQLYLDALQTAQSHSAHEALKHFPMDRVMRRFARVWSTTDPTHVKVMRRTGNVIEFPLKMLLGAAGWARDQFLMDRPDPPPSKEFAKNLDEDLATAVTKMNYQAVSSQISVSGSRGDPVAGKMLEIIELIRAGKNLAKAQPPKAEPAGDGTTFTFLIDAHPVVKAEQEKLRARDFKTVLQSILAEKEDIVAITRDMEKDLEKLADHFRSKMGLWRKIKQTFWAFLNVLPATVAVTYVLSTGDPVGAAGIKVKLAGLFGAKDLYALFAIPVTTGLKSADRKQIEEMLAPIVQTWLNHKLNTVQHLLEENITGGILQCARNNLEDAGGLMVTTEELLANLTRSHLKKRILVQDRGGAEFSRKA
jgi:hypothetical protein